MSGLQLPKVMVRFTVNSMSYRLLKSLKQLVSRVSACLPGHPRIPLNVRHTMMNKFRGPEDGSFVLVSGQLKDIARNSRIDQARTEEERKCLQLLTSSYMEDKNRIEQRIPGTCTWFLKHPKFLHWYQQTTSSLLYVSADPGCGKTVLSRALVDEGLLSPDIRTSSFCYFFFKDDDINCQSGANALCAILHQLFVQKPALLKHAMYDFQIHGERLHTMFNTLWDILEKSVGDEEAGEVICVFDALDECEDLARKEFIRRLGQFHSSQSKINLKLKLLVTSRPYYGIGRAFRSTVKDMASISLKGEDEWEMISKEIDLVIDDQIPRISNAREAPFTSDVQDALIKHLKEIPHRTYLWLHLMLNAIRESLDSTAFRLERLVSKLPRSIEDAYEKILRKVDNDSERAQEARTLLHIVVAAVRPLTIQEMNLALAVDEKVRIGQSCQSYSDLTLEYEDAFAEKVRNLCGLFVTVINARIYLIHQTAKEFLVAKQHVLSTPSPEVWKYSLKPVESNSVILKICLYYLLLDEIDGEIDDEFDGEIDNEIDKVTWTIDLCYFPKGLHFTAKDSPEFNFLNYAGENWSTHFRGANIGVDDAIMSSVLHLFDTQSDRFRRWIQVYLKTHPRSGLLFRRDLTSLTSASYVGVSAAVKLLVKQDDAKPHAEDNDIAASFNGAILGDQIDIVEMLLKQDSNLLNGRYDGQTPLSVAVSSGSLKMTQFLLNQEDIDPNLEDSGGCTELLLSGGNDPSKITEETIRKYGINIDSKPEETHLLIAAALGQSRVADSLLRSPGVEPGRRDKMIRTPLLWDAAEEKSERIDSLLSSLSVDPDRGDEDGRTPLLWDAVQERSEEVRSLLSSLRVDPDRRDENGRTPRLWDAAGEQSKRVDSLLRGYDIEPNCKDENGRTPLLYAAARGELEIVILLLKAPGVEPDRKDENGRTPLLWAAALGELEVVDSLLRTPGVEPDCKDNNGRTPLSWGAFLGQLKVVERLLGQDAIEINSKDDWGQTPLSWAAHAGNVQVVKLLLAQKGIDPYSRDNQGRMAISWATEQGYSEVVELLVRRDSTDPDFGTRMAQAMFLWSVSGESLSEDFKHLSEQSRKVYSWYCFEQVFGHFSFASDVKKGNFDLIKFLFEHFEAVKFQSECKLFEDKGIQAIFDNHAGKGVFKAAEKIIETALDLSSQMHLWGGINIRSDLASLFRKKLKSAEEVLQAARNGESADKILFQAYEKMSRAAEVTQN